MVSFSARGPLMYEFELDSAKLRKLLKKLFLCGWPYLRKVFDDQVALNLLWKPNLQSAFPICVSLPP